MAKPITLLLIILLSSLASMTAVSKSHSAGHKYQHLLQDPCIVFGAQTIISQSFSHRFDTLDKRLNYVKRFYSIQGWKQLQSVLSKERILQTVKKHKGQLKMTVLDLPKMESSNTKNNIKNWVVSYPVKIVYYKNSKVIRSDNYFFEVGLKFNVKVNPLPLVNSFSSKRIQYTRMPNRVKPTKICKKHISSPVEKRFHSDSEILIWIDEAMQQVFISNNGAEYFSRSAWKKWLLANKSIMKNNKLITPYVYNSNMPAMIQSHGVHDNRYYWDVIKTIRLMQSGKIIKKTYHFKLKRSLDHGVREIIIDDVK